MVGIERQMLKRRYQDVELRAKAPAECSDLIARKPSAPTAGLARLRINRRKDSDAIRGAIMRGAQSDTANRSEAEEKAR